MAELVDFKGIYPMLYAFFDAAGRLDRAAMCAQVDYCVASGAHGVAVLGLGTEVSKLTPLERRQAMQWAAEDLRGTGATAVAAEADVTDRGAVDAALDKLRAELGPIQIMVTSAGLDSFESFTEITVGSWERVLAINLTGTFHCLQAAVPDMLKARWGRMVTISSSSAQSGAVRMAHYVASKGGVIGLTKALAIEYAPKGITVNTIPPALIDTPMARRAEERGDLPSIDAIIPRVPVRRAGTPDDIAAAILGHLQAAILEMEALTAELSDELPEAAE